MMCRPGRAVRFDPAGAGEGTAGADCASIFVLGLVLVLCCVGISQAHNGKTAYAIPLVGITIDGKLDDWV